MLPGSVAWFPALSVTLMVNVNVPATVGVPPTWPLVSTTPGGSWPTATVQVNGPGAADAGMIFILEWLCRA